jgi:hypothetical protein
MATGEANDPLAPLGGPHHGSRPLRKLQATPRWGHFVRPPSVGRDRCGSKPLSENVGGPAYLCGWEPTRRSPCGVRHCNLWRGGYDLSSDGNVDPRLRHVILDIKVLNRTVAD